MDCAQVGVLEESNQVGLRSLLQGRDGRGLKAKVSLEVLSNLANKALEGQLADQELGGLLVLANFAKADEGSRKVLYIEVTRAKEIAGLTRRCRGGSGGAS